MKHRISAGAIVEHQGRFLLVRHCKPGVYDFWVAPGGGVEGSESLQAAAEREVYEETGLAVTATRLAYIEQLQGAVTRHVKFWFAATLTRSGAFDHSHPEAVIEHIVEAAWIEPAALAAMTVFPLVLTSRWPADREAGFPAPVVLPLRTMSFE